MHRHIAWLLRNEVKKIKGLTPHQARKKKKVERRKKAALPREKIKNLKIGF